MNIDFTNKIVLITGATRGIGKCTAQCFHELNASLLLTGSNKAETDRLNEEISHKGIKNIQYIYVDFTDKKSTEDFLYQLNCYNRIDICVNNAGVNKINDFVESSFSELEWISEINIHAPYKVLKILGPKMIAHQYGRIVNVASIWSTITRQGRSIYSLSKHALVGLTKTLAVEWASFNIMVNAVSPGFTLTELTEATNTPSQIQTLTTMIPAQRMAKPIEIAKIIMFLCSDQNSYLTGQNIIVDGGYSII